MNATYMGIGMSNKSAGKIGKLTTKQQEALGKIRSTILYHRNRIINGTFVAIDPSCVSATGSKPAYAIYQKGEFVEQGIIDVKYKPALSYRLQMMRKVISESIAPHVDLLIIEDVPVRPIRTMKQAASSGKTFMNFNSISSLKKACGTIISAFEVGTPVIEFPANLWQKMVHNAGLEISKKDDDDARWIGWAAIRLLTEMGEMCDAEDEPNDDA
jgi:hypothetical protein